MLRVDFPGSNGQAGVAHLSLPSGDGPHPGVVVFPILAGSHIVSEALSKVLVGRGYAVLRMERQPLDLDAAPGPEAPMAAFRSALRDARSLLDWLAERPDVDGERLAAAGVSLGGILAARLMAEDPRLRAGFFIMAGGGLAELMHDSTEKPVAAFRKRMKAQHGLESREAFVGWIRPYTDPFDPALAGASIAPESVLLISGRFDRVVPKERTLALWEALGRPEWKRFPAGHYQLLPFFWWAAARGADHLDRVIRLESVIQ